jgi:hypothetical protein
MISIRDSQALSLTAHLDRALAYLALVSEGEAQ